MIFNGVTFDDFSVIEYVRRHLMPSRNVNILNTGGLKNHFIGVEHGMASVEVDIRVISKRREDVHDIYNIMATALAVDKPMPIYLRDEPGKFNMAIVSGDTELHNFLHTGFVTVVFDLPDPYLYNTEIRKLINVNNTSIINRGGAASDGFITIRMTGATNQLVVRLKDDPRTITIKYAFKTNDIVLIDLESEDVWLNNTTYLASTLDSDFFQIPPGFFSVNTNTGVLDLEYRERWL